MMSFDTENRTNCPCKECPDRNPGCHDKCEAYAEWKKKLDEYKQKEREFHQSNNVMSDAKKKTIWKSKRYNARVGHGRKIGTT